MFQTYAIIGTFLSVAAIIYSYYFFNYLKGNKDNFSITALSDTIITFFIGLFYVYSAIILSTQGQLNGDNGMQNFTNNIGDILTIDYDNQTEFNIYPEVLTTATTENVINVEIMYSSPVTEEIGTESITSENSAIPEDIQDEITTNVPEIVTIAPEIVTISEATKKDQFLSNYQNFIKQILKQKSNYSSGIINRDGIFNFNGPPTVRQKRENKNDTEPEENCFNKTFYEDALLISSFIHCLINLLNQTLYCKKCINDNENGGIPNNEENSAKKENKDKDDNHGSASETQASVLSDNSSDKESAATVGPLFIDKPKTELDSYSPNIEIFQAKCTSKVDLFNNESSNEEQLTESKIKSVVEILISWIMPILATLILYFLMTQQMKYENNDDISPINIPNFNTTRVNPNIMHVMQHPNSSILDKIISNVYHVVDQVKKNNTNKATPSTLELLQYMSHQNRVPKQKKSEMCPKITTLGIKLYYFFIYLAILLGIVFYGKIVQIIAKTKSSEYSNQLNNSLISFSVMWLPSIAEVLIRTFFDGNKVGILSDIFLFLGNSNQLYTMASNYYQCKRNNKCNIVEPQP